MSAPAFPAAPSSASTPAAPAASGVGTGAAAPAATKPPALELFVDMPNFERALKKANLPHKLDLWALGTQIAPNLYGTGYFLKRVNGFAAKDQFDHATGLGVPEGHHAALAGLRGVHLTLGHRTAYADTRGSASDVSQAEVGGEKGVDVGLAVSMIERACDGTYDAALLISNDSDYCGLMRRVRARGKLVYWAHLQYQRGHQRMVGACTQPYLLSPSLIRACVLKGGR